MGLKPSLDGYDRQAAEIADYLTVCEFKAWYARPFCFQEK
jgi:hypothetical protein